MHNRQVAPEFVVLGESYEAAKQVKVDTRDGLEIFFGVVDFDANQQAFGMVSGPSVAWMAFLLCPCSLKMLTRVSRLPMQYDFTSAPHIVYVAPDHAQDKGHAVPSKAKAPPQNVFNIYTQGKDAESLNQFVKQHTGFDVRLSCPVLGTVDSKSY